MNWTAVVLSAVTATVLWTALRRDADEKEEERRAFDLENITFYQNSKTLLIRTHGKSFTGALGHTITYDGDKLIDEKIQENAAIFSWNSGASLAISSTAENEPRCYTISWLVGANRWPMDCFQFSNGHWYGGAEVYHQHWPMSDPAFSMQPYISMDAVSHSTRVFGSFVERYFLNSEGFSIIVHEDTPLWVSINSDNDDKICFMARYNDRDFPRMERQNISLSYDICVAEDIKAVHQHSMKTYFSKPTSIPDEKMFRYPIWSTWAQYKQEINETAVLEFAKSIGENGFPNSQLEIDDKWSTFYGDLTFDPDKFPNPKKLIETLHSMGYRVTLWTIPFASINSKIFQELMDYCIFRDGLFEQWSSNSTMFVSTSFSDTTPALTRWWNGFGVLVDYTNSEAVQWYTRRLKEFQEFYGIDSFKFDGGEAEYLPTALGTSASLNNSARFTKFYVESVSSFGGMIEVRSGYRTQHLPIFVRMMDKDSVWSYENGLRTLIPTCLTLGITGYPFILPDMIGGNVYHGASIPDAELFIRWLEVTAFMPSMQFSVAPWQYEDENVLNITKKYVDLHASYVTPLILRFANEATEKVGSPIIRPIWWVSPRDEVALTIDDEFLIGDKVLVAPILDKGAFKRDVYLPGPSNWKWKDVRTGKVYDAGAWTRDVEILLEDIAYFEVLKHG